MPDGPALSVVLGILGAAVTVVVTTVYVVTAILLTIPGGVGVGLYLAAWIAWVYEYGDLV